MSYSKILGFGSASIERLNIEIAPHIAAGAVPLGPIQGIAEIDGRAYFFITLGIGEQKVQSFTFKCAKCGAIGINPVPNKCNVCEGTIFYRYI